MDLEEFRPYQDDSAVLEIGGVVVENGSLVVSIYGSVDLPRDKRGLERAKRLQALLGRIVDDLERAADLPDEVPASPEAPLIDNPFS